MVGTARIPFCMEERVTVLVAGLLWFPWALSFCALVFAGCQRMNGKKGLVLALLLTRGEMTGRQLRDAGVGSLVYTYLYDLEKEGLVERSGLVGPPREGFLPRYYYRVVLPPFEQGLPPRQVRNVEA